MRDQYILQFSEKRKLTTLSKTNKAVEVLLSHLRKRDIQLKDINRTIVTGWLDKLKSDRAPQTIQNYISALAQIWDLARNRYHDAPQDNPWRGHGLEAKSSKISYEVFTHAELAKVFAAMGGVGRVIGAVFFLALGFAALTSCVSVMETLVANCMEIFRKSRKEMCAAVGVYSLVTAVLICMGYNALYFELPLPNGSTAQLLDVMDYISNSFLMPFISLLTSILVGWVVGPKWIIAEVEKNGEHFGRAKLYSVMMKYVVPVVMLILFLTSTGLGSLILGGR